MREKNASLPKQSETEEQVKLKPVMGIRPGVYLTVLYSIVLLGVLFFLLVFPGLKKPGAVLQIKTEPAGAAIRVDGVYMGTAGSTEKIFVPKGIHTLEAVLPGFTLESGIHEIPGRVFGSLFFPLRYPVYFTLKTSDPAAAFAQSAADFAAWSFGGEPTAVWQIPLSLSEGAYRIGNENNLTVEEILQAASRFTVTRAALRDIVRAKILLDNNGLSPSPAGLIGSVSEILSFLSENTGSAAWLSSLLPPEYAAIVKSSEWYKNEYKDIVNPSVKPETARRFEIDGLSFTGIAAGILYQELPYPHNVEIKSMMVSEKSVPKPLYEIFLNENPSWKNGEENDQYPAEIARGDEAAGVSWYAAEAFCQWLTRRLPASMAGMEVRLPTEAEWEYAAKSGIFNMGNRGWEWCSDPFVHLPFIKAAPEAINAVGSPERSLRGGFWPSSLTPETRASLPPDFSSPFITIRPIIAEK